MSELGDDERPVALKDEISEFGDDTLVCDERSDAPFLLQILEICRNCSTLSSCSTQAKGNVIVCAPCTEEISERGHGE